MPLIMTLDGMPWGYGRAGRPGGRPVLVHHGLIGDAAFHPLMADLGQACDIDWIVVERPGYGGTPPVEMQQLAEWPERIGPVLDALGITGPFDAIGVSAGAPYAYSLAAGMPGRVGRLGILSGVPFIGVGAVLDAYPADARVAYTRYATADEAELRDEFRAFCTAMSERFHGHADMAAALAAILEHDAAGPAREARLQAVDWGFEPDSVRCPVGIWHSKEDDLVPYAAARRSADHLPAARWHIQAEPSHMASDVTLREMANWLSAVND